MAGGSLAQLPSPALHGGLPRPVPCSLPVPPFLRPLRSLTAGGLRKGGGAVRRSLLVGLPEGLGDPDRSDALVLPLSPIGGRSRLVWARLGGAPIESDRRTAVSTVLSAKRRPGVRPGLQGITRGLPVGYGTKPECRGPHQHQAWRMPQMHPEEDFRNGQSPRDQRKVIGLVAGALAGLGLATSAFAQVISRSEER